MHIALESMSVEYPQEVLIKRGSTSAFVEQSGFVEVNGESYYCIKDSSEMPPFLMNVVSGSNHWMFVGSNGSITAGRRNADNALFPYCTQDKLFELVQTTGPKTCLWVRGEGDSEKGVLWEPFCGELKSGELQRNLYKSIDGSRVIFEEINVGLALTYRYSWSTSDRFGFVKQSELINLGGEAVEVRLLDGIQNLVPYGIDQDFVTQFSNLADAYKKNELLESEGLGVYYLSSIPTDRAEPSEGLKATVAWSIGLEAESVLLSPRQVDAFRSGEPLCLEDETRGLRCAYFVESRLSLAAGSRQEWIVVADINQDAADVEAARVALGDKVELKAALLEDIDLSRSVLVGKIGASDGLQLTSDPLRDARHCSNTMFNIMRGGIFDDGYAVGLADFKKYLASWNTRVLSTHETRLGEFRETLSCFDLVKWAEGTGDLDLIRLTNEYLPLSFSRRHGDPSRPWNKFSIETQDENENPVLAYQGNWRDIFQNWEPLAYSYPGYLVGMISRFLNASTADGYNPYRVTRDGFDWELLDPEEPWSNIGYWGDHQIIYLLRLLEALEKHSPQSLDSLLSEDRFVYAHVPYRIRGFAAIWENPRDTVDYDDAAADAIANRTRSVGSDDKLLVNTAGEVVRANLMGKLLAPLLAKMSNFVLDGGIWMNTQRPEWNDANNALVGYGVSVVTLCYINRYLEFLETLLSKAPAGSSVMLDEVQALFLVNQWETLKRNESSLKNPVDAAIRFEMLKALGEGGEAFRNTVYESGFGEEKREVSIAFLLDYVQKALVFVGHSIDSNRRSDGMYHSYNLLSPLDEGQVEIDRLPEMLEGQVAVLSSNRLDPENVLSLLKSLRSSRLYREDVESYLLYPDKDLPSFLEKNKVDGKSVESSALLKQMLDRKDERIVKVDVSGNYRYCGDFKNAADVSVVLDLIKADYSEGWSDDAAGEVLSLFEDTFNHRSFTGRSGTFFGYEGLGSVYWHMVSKLVLAIQENCFKAKRVGTDKAVVSSLGDFYFETLNGLGFDKDPVYYGAFPTDAYSHTPMQSGAQQPGMTGQVKEDILSRWGELGVIVEGGCLRFDPVLLKASSFLEKPGQFTYIDMDGVSQSVDVEASSLTFTYCQVLVRYVIGESDKLVIEGQDGTKHECIGLQLSASESAAIFSRDRSYRSIDVTISRNRLI